MDGDEMWGTLINVATVLAGSGLGVLLGHRVPESLRRFAFTVLGMVVVVLGLQMALKSQQVLIPMLSLLFGGIAGSAWRLEERLRGIGETLTRGRSHLVEGFMAASLLFCVGAMTLLGAIEEGISGTYKIYALKATMDGIAALAFSSAMGWGVALSAITILVVQGGLTLGAGVLQPFLGEPMVTELSATGGFVLLALGLGMLEIKKIPVADLLPALLLAPLLFGASHLIPLP